MQEWCEICENQKRTQSHGKLQIFLDKRYLLIESILTFYRYKVAMDWELNYYPNSQAFTFIILIGKLLILPCSLKYSSLKYLFHCFKKISVILSGWFIQFESFNYAINRQIVTSYMNWIDANAQKQIYPIWLSLSDCIS